MTGSAITVGGNSGDGIPESISSLLPVVCLLNAEIVQGVGRSGDEIDESVREEGRSVRRVLNADSAREAVDPALMRVREIPSDDDDRLLVPRVVDIRLDGRCSFSSRSLFRANPFSAVFFLSEPRGSTLTVADRDKLT